MMIYKLIGILIIGAWFILSLLRLGYNIEKLFTEESKLFFMSDDEKRQLYLGETYSLIKFVENKTIPNSSIIVFSLDKKLYYMGRYYLYPRRLVNVSFYNELLSAVKKNRPNYIITFTVDETRVIEKIVKHLDIRKIFTLKSKNTKQEITIYSL